VELDTHTVFQNLALSRRWAVHLFEFVDIQLFSKKNEINIFILVKRDLESLSTSNAESQVGNRFRISTYLTQTFSLSNYSSIRA
jgi:hypothetical protein